MNPVKHIRPINNRVLIKIDKTYDPEVYQTASGIQVICRNKPRARDRVGEIIKLGTHMYQPDGSRIDLSDFLSVGDKVMYYYPAEGFKFSYDGNDYILVRAEDIDCIIRKE